MIWIRGGKDGVEGLFGEEDLGSHDTDFFGGLSFLFGDLEGGGGVVDGEAADAIFTGIV